MCNSCNTGCLPSAHAYSIGTYPSYSLNCGHNCYCAPKIAVSANVCSPSGNSVLKTCYEPTKPPVFWAKAQHKAAVEAQMAADESVIKSEYAQTCSNESNSDLSKALISDDAAEVALFQATAAFNAADAAKKQAQAIKDKTAKEFTDAKTDAAAAKTAADAATLAAETATENAEAKLKEANDKECAEKKEFEDKEEILKRTAAKKARAAAMVKAEAAAASEKAAADLEKAASIARAKANGCYTTGTCQPCAPEVCAPICPPVVAYCPPAYSTYTYTPYVASASRFGHHGCC